MIFIIIGIVFFAQHKINFIGNILESTSFIDSIVIKDGKTKEELLTLTDTESSFSELVNIDKSPVHKLNYQKESYLKKNLSSK